jgi:hypothetical protein
LIRQWRTDFFQLRRLGIRKIGDTTCFSVIFSLKNDELLSGAYELHVIDRLAVGFTNNNWLYI